ncbi:mitochondrial inner membrane protein Mitofilin [Glomus cerebriforme]|uniref:MICOS complex subunit MIC60 n=1 Tax=Glomus cerebriforme TaxID=658196 RepID=A0A397THE1_9GLOM|nr:mitochondrial inner membrane protein Mitofilin [Glomus cerebriforme]
MQRRWIRDVKVMVEQERGGRLARLDNINHKLKILERISIDNVERLDKSLKAHRLWCALRSLQDAVEQPHRTPFVNQITAMKQLSSADEVVTTVLSTIDDNVANNGVDSVSDLSARFAIVREQVRRASLVPENGGVFAHLLSYMFSKILFHKHGLVKGNDVESILARVQFYLNENDLDTATRELNQLKGWPKKLAKDWIKAARNHLEIKQAIEVIETQATLSSLSVV